MNKLTKVLSVFIIAGAVGAGVAGVAGCKKEHTHSIDITKWTDNYDGTHDGHCSCGHLMVDDEEHLIVDGECIKCHAPEGDHEHSYSYTDNEDGTHDGTCVCGKDNITDEPHHYVDGACEECGAAQGPVVESVTINGVTAVEVEMTLNLTATVNGSNGISQKVIWSVTNGTGEATITQDGVLTAGSAGTVTVKATSDADMSKFDEKTITINALTEYGRLMKRTDKLTVLDGSYTVGSKLSTLENYATKGIYFRPQTGGSTAATDPARDYVEVINSDGLALKQHGSDGGTTGLPNVYTEIVMGPVKGTVEGYFETKISALTKGDANDNGQNPIAFLNNGSAVLTINAKGGTLSYKVGSGDLTAISGVTLAADTYVKVQFAFDLENGKTTLKLNGTTVMNEVVTNITSIDCIELATSNKGARVQTTKNIVVCGTEMSAAEYKTIIKTKLADEYGSYILSGDGATHSINGGLVTAAYAEGDGAIDTANTIAEMSAAYTTAVKKMAAVLSDAAVEAARQAACDKLDEDYPVTDYTTTGLTGDDAKYNNQKAFGDALEAAKGEIATKNTPDDIAAAVAKHKAILDAIKTDTQVLAAKITEAKDAIDAYKADDVAALEGGDYNSIYNQIVEAKASGKASLSQCTSVAQVNEQLDTLKEDIDSLYALTQMSVEEAQAAAIAELEEYVAGKLEDEDGTKLFDPADDDDKEVIDLLVGEDENGGVKKSGADAINAATSISDVTLALEKAKTTADFIVARGEAVQGIKAYSESLKKEYYLDTALALFDTEAAKQVGLVKAVAVPGTDAENWEELFETANQSVEDKAGAAETALDGKKADATALELAARSTWSGQTTISSTKEVNFYNMKDSGLSLTAGTTNFGSDFLLFNAKGSKISWKTSEGGLSMTGGSLKVTTTTANAKLTICYYSPNSSRVVTVTSGSTTVEENDANVYLKQAPSTANGWSANNNYKDKNGNFVDLYKEIELGAAGNYYISFDSNEHKLEYIKLVEAKTETITDAKVNKLTAVKEGDNTVVKAEIELADKSKATVTLDASEYTLLADGVTVVYGTGKTAADANKYNSCKITEQQA